MSMSSPPNAATRSDTTDLRELAITRLRKRRELQAHLLAYVMVSLFLNGIWLLTMPGGFYWPMIPMFLWGIGVAFHMWDVYSPEVPGEERIDREMARLHRR
jgi:2TM domain